MLCKNSFDICIICSLQFYLFIFYPPKKSKTERENVFNSTVIIVDNLFTYWINLLLYQFIFSYTRKTEMIAILKNFAINDRNIIFWLPKYIFWLFIIFSYFLVGIIRMSSYNINYMSWRRIYSQNLSLEHSCSWCELYNKVNSLRDHKFILQN